MSIIKARQQAALQAFAAAEERLKTVRNYEDKRRAEVASLEAQEALDLLSRAEANAQPMGRFMRCNACRNPFHDEGSYLKHWQYSSNGRIACVFTPSILKVMGFVADEHKTANGHMLVLRMEL